MVRTMWDFCQNRRLYSCIERIFYFGGSSVRFYHQSQADFKRRQEPITRLSLAQSLRFIFLLLSLFLISYSAAQAAEYKTAKTVDSEYRYMDFDTFLAKYQITIQVGFISIPPNHDTLRKILVAVESNNQANRLPGLEDELNPTMLDPARVEVFLKKLPILNPETLASLEKRFLYLNSIQSELSFSSPITVENLRQKYSLLISQVAVGQMVKPTLQADIAFDHSRFMAVRAHKAMMQIHQDVQQLEVRVTNLQKQNAPADLAVALRELSLARSKRYATAVVWRNHTVVLSKIDLQNDGVAKEAAAATKAASEYLVPPATGMPNPSPSDFSPEREKAPVLRHQDLPLAPSLIPTRKPHAMTQDTAAIQALQALDAAERAVAGADRDDARRAIDDAEKEIERLGGAQGDALRPRLNLLRTRLAGVGKQFDSNTRDAAFASVESRLHNAIMRIKDGQSAPDELAKVEDYIAEVAESLTDQDKAGFNRRITWLRKLSDTRNTMDNARKYMRDNLFTIAGVGVVVCILISFLVVYFVFPLVKFLRSLG